MVVRKPKLRPLADLVDTCLSPALAAQGFAASDVIVAWPEIVGERLASFSQPVKVEWKRQSRPVDPDARPEPATLVVRVESAFALELQHLAPLVIERVNTHYGWRCVGRLVLKQGPLPRPSPRRDRTCRRRARPIEGGSARLSRRLRKTGCAPPSTGSDRP